MSQGPPPPPDPLRSSGDSPDPYARLGIPADSAFDAVQAARQERLQELSDDPIACSRVEAAYDAILMDRLKERQQGRVSSAARSASQREQASPPPRPALPSLGGIPQLPVARLSPAAANWPRLSLASGRERWFPLAADAVLLLLLLLPGTVPELLLALATGVTLLNLQRRRSRFLAAIGWSAALLVIGLVVGAALVALLQAQFPFGLPVQETVLQSVPALLLLLLGALLIA